MKTSRALVTVTLSALSIAALAGCAADAPAAEHTSEATLTVVASTNVYGQLVEQIGGDAVEVTSIVTSAGQDPHSFEPSAQDQLAVSRADLIVRNGGGYDAYIDALIESSGTQAPVVTAVEYSHDYPGGDGHADEAEHDAAQTPAASSSSTPEAAEDAHAHADEGHAHAEDEHAQAEEEHAHEHIAGFNEHVWYDPHTIEHVVEAITDELAFLSPQHVEMFGTNAEALVKEIGMLESALAELEATDAGAPVFVTEPVSLYLIAAAGLENVAPADFTEAVEEGRDVPAATLLQADRLIEAGQVRAVITNTQTGGAETARVAEAAAARDIPVVEFAETLPEGETYFSWMNGNVAALADALSQ